MKKIISMNVMPQRVSNLEHTVPILSPQCDKLFINLVGFGNTPNLPYDNIEYTHFDNVGAEYKFYHYNSIKSGDYYFTVDDDIIYPKNYVGRYIEKLKEYDDEVIICSHGSIINLNQNSNFLNNNRKIYNFKTGLPADVKVHFPGTGTLAMSGDLLKFKMSDFKVKNMDDNYIGCFAKSQNIDVISISRSNNWIVPFKEHGIGIYGNNPIKEIDKLIHKYFKI